jgi:hypothetical protein
LLDTFYRWRRKYSELAVAKPRCWGSPRLTRRLRREGWAVNHGRIERLVREELECRKVSQSIGR